MRWPAELCSHLMVMTECSRRPQWARERRRAKGIVNVLICVMCAWVSCLRFFFLLILFFVLSARALDTSCIGFEFTLWLKTFCTW